MHYRAAGWQGVYVPQILARGLTPADWNSYLTQQRRWARSVLDIKFRERPSLGSKTPTRTRVISLLHGLNYIAKGLLPVVFLAVLAFLCLRGQLAELVLQGLAAPMLAVAVAFGLSEAFRQRFYLDPKRECGIHWRAAALRWAKWPQTVLAVIDVALNRRPAYSITGKGPAARQSAAWLWPHVLVSGLVLSCWAAGLSTRNGVSPLLDGAVAVVVLATVALCMSCFAAGRTATAVVDAEPRQ
jgi:hypothetical protein